MHTSMKLVPLASFALVALACSSSSDGDLSNPDASSKTDAPSSSDGGAVSDGSSLHDGSSSADAAQNVDGGSLESGVPESGVEEAGSDGQATDGSGGDAGTLVGTCNVVGTFLEPTTALYWRYQADGTWQTDATIAGLDSDPRSTGHWSLSGTTITDDDIGSPSPNACPANEIGTYTVSFDATCVTMTWTLITDPCSPRANYFDGTPRTRQ